MNHLVSIIIPVYNRPDEVDELLESLTRQTVKDFEVVVVEDGSTVPCKEVVEKYQAVDSSQFTADSSHADEEKLSTLNCQLSTLNSQLSNIWPKRTEALALPATMGWSTRRVSM